MTEQTKKNAYEAMKAFKKIASDNLEYYAVAADYIPEIEKLYNEALEANNETLVNEIQWFLNDLKENAAKYNFIKDNPA